MAARTSRPRGEGVGRRLILTLAPILAFVVLWQALASALHPLYFPTPVAISGELGRVWLTGTALRQDVAPSFVRVLLGWALAGVVGVPVGGALGLWPRAAGFVKPLIHYARAVPPPVVLPIFMIFFGVGDAMKVAFIAAGIVWPVLLNAAKGVESVDRLLLDTATVYGIRGGRRLVSVVAPAALPDILAGLRISLALAFVLMVISEMIAASGGIGYEILQSQAQFDVLDMWAGMVVLAVGGVVCNAALSAVERRVLFWQRGLTRHEAA
jgi:ABC-type nitrate/sulfonate/bicarbonate transport system permease component